MFRPLLSGGKVLLEVVFDQVEQMRACGLSGDAVCLAGIQHQLELLAGVNESVDHLDGVLHVDVVVAGAVNFQQAAMQVGREHEGPIHLMVTDVVMPQMSGGELAQRLSAERPDTVAPKITSVTPA